MVNQDKNFQKKQNRQEIEKPLGTFDNNSNNEDTSKNSGELPARSETVDFIKSLGKANTYKEPSLEWYKSKKELDSYLIEREALLFGLTVTRYSGLLFNAEDSKGKATGFYWSSGLSPSIVAKSIAKKKQLTKLYLEKNSVPVPRGKIFPVDALAEAINYLRELNSACVVKPAVGTGGLGVTIGVTTEDEMRWAWNEIVSSKKTMARNDGFIIVEEHMPGNDYRFLVVGGKVVSVIRRVPSNVIGDGKLSIEKLVKKKNQSRKSNPFLGRIRIKLNNNAIYKLSKQNLELNSVPEAGRVVFLSNANNSSQGADTIRIFSEVHNSIIETAEKAVNSIPGLLQAGVDFIMQDHTAALQNQKAAICEINTVPVIASHHFPAFGTPCNVSRSILMTNAKHSGVSLSNRPVEAESLSVYIKHHGPYEEIIDVLKKRLKSTGAYIKNTKKDNNGFQLTIKGNFNYASAAVSSLISNNTDNLVEYIEVKPEYKSTASSAKGLVRKLFK